MKIPTSTKKKKPSRPCLFCLQMFVDLRKHLLQKHKNEPRVKSIMDKEKTGEISRKERIIEFEHLRKEGMLLLNKKLIAQNRDDELHCVRKSNGPKVKCSNCDGFFKEKYFTRHRKSCKGSAETTEIVEIPKAVRPSAIINHPSRKRHSPLEEEWHLSPRRTICMISSTMMT